MSNLKLFDLQISLINIDQEVLELEVFLFSFFFFFKLLITVNSKTPGRTSVPKKQTIINYMRINFVALKETMKNVA